jgi:hypothetical protein
VHDLELGEPMTMQYVGMGAASLQRVVRRPSCCERVETRRPGATTS